MSEKFVNFSKPGKLCPQAQDVLEYLKKHKTLNCVKSSRAIGVAGNSLPRRIKDIEDVLGQKIERRKIEYITRKGKLTHITEYDFSNILQPELF